MGIRNIAIIAHVDHGKTTLVDHMILQWTQRREGQVQEERVMDNNDQEKERGITIYAKNTSVFYKWNKINVVDTPGHADFGSEVERVLRMVDSVLLVVDAYEGPMPQTKFVLKKSLELGIKPIVVINKIDKPTARPDDVVDMLFDLFVKLGATDEQLDFPYCLAIARDWIAKMGMDEESSDLTPLFDMIMEKVVEADNDEAKPFRMQVANLGYDSFLWRLAIWRVYDWVAKVGQNVTVFWNNWEKRKGKISKILTSEGLKKVETETAVAWDIVTIAGIPDIFVWETIAFDETVEPLPPITIDEPTLEMEFLVNDSPFAGKEGKFLTTRHIRDRLEKELETNVWLKINFDAEGGYSVAWRWELHLSVLIETMRREGYELQVWAPKVIFQQENGQKLEPMEKATVNLPDEFAGAIIEELWKRKGEMTNMTTENGITNLEFMVPTRWLLWFKSLFTTLTKGEWIMASAFEEYAEYKWDIPKREVWSMIAWEKGTAMAYSLWKLQERGPLFIEPGIELYEGMIIWEHLKGWDLVVNATKNKQLTNVRASGSDEALKLTTPRLMTLEDALDYIGPDEFVEVTPNNIRIRKKFLTENERKRNKRG